MTFHSLATQICKLNKNKKTKRGEVLEILKIQALLESETSQVLAVISAAAAKHKAKQK